MEIMLIKYLLVINVISVFIFGIDKKAAINKSSRYSEKFLLLLSLLGGAVGGSVGMLLFHHKTSKSKFNVIVPLLGLIYLIVILVLVWKNI